MRACAILACFFFLASCHPTDGSWCGTSVSKQEMLDALCRLVPMSDGSHLSTEDPAAAKLIDVVSGNLRAMGLSMECTEASCDISALDSGSGSCARAFVAAILGNFLNNDLKPGDALARVRVDVNTGLLRREYPDNHSRILFVDFLLVLAVIMLAKRAVDDQNNKT